MTQLVVRARKNAKRVVESLTGKSMKNSDKMTIRGLEAGSKAARKVNEKLVRSKKLADNSKKIGAASSVLAGGAVLASIARKKKDES